MIDFWNYNLNPITMYSNYKGMEQPTQIDSYKGRIPIGNLCFDKDIHIYSTDAMKLTGERAKNLKKKIINAGGNVYVHFSRSVYLISDIRSLPQFKEILT